MTRVPRPVMAFSAVCTIVALVGCRTGDTRRQSSGEYHQGHSPRHEGRHGPHGRDLSSYIAAMESPQRATWQQPDEVIAALKLKPGERIADVGAGPGYFTVRLARAVGPTGRVWAVDIEPRMLDRLREHAEEAGLANVEYVLAPEGDPSLPPGFIDTILIVNTYHHFADRKTYAAKLRAALAPGGRVVNIDFVPKPREERGFGPPLEMQLPRETVDTEMATAGLHPTAVYTFLPEQYFVEYRASSE